MSLAPAPSPVTHSDEQSPPPRRAHRLSLSALSTLFTFTLRQHRHGKRWMIMAGLMLLPAGLTILVRSTAHDVPSVGLEFIFAFMFIPQALLPLVSLIYASGIIQDEQKEQ